MLMSVKPFGAARVFLVYHVPMLLYASAIITVSSIPDLKGPELRIIAFDKMAHLLEYAIFAFLTFRSFANLLPHIRLGLAFAFSLAFLAVFAAFDEYYQRFVPGRVPDLKDYAFDMLGVLTVLLLVWFWRRHSTSNSG
jgi:VanZ family protein